MWRAVVVVVLLCGRFQAGLILSHQLQLADLRPGVLDSLWHLQHKHTAQQHQFIHSASSLYPTCLVQGVPRGDPGPQPAESMSHIMVYVSLRGNMDKICMNMRN